MNAGNISSSNLADKDITDTANVNAAGESSQVQQRKKIYLPTELWLQIIREFSFYNLHINIKPVNRQLCSIVGRPDRYLGLTFELWSLIFSHLSYKFLKSDIQVVSKTFQSLILRPQTKELQSMLFRLPYTAPIIQTPTIKSTSHLPARSCPVVHPLLSSSGIDLKSITSFSEIRLNGPNRLLISTVPTLFPEKALNPPTQSLKITIKALATLTVTNATGITMEDVLNGLLTLFKKQYTTLERRRFINEISECCCLSLIPAYDPIWIVKYDLHENSLRHRSELESMRITEIMALSTWRMFDVYVGAKFLKAAEEDDDAPARQKERWGIKSHWQTEWDHCVVCPTDDWEFDWTEEVLALDFDGDEFGEGQVQVQGFEDSDLQVGGDQRLDSQDDLENYVPKVDGGYAVVIRGVSACIHGEGRGSRLIQADSDATRQRRQPWRPSVRVAWLKNGYD